MKSSGRPRTWEEKLNVQEALKDRLSGRWIDRNCFLYLPHRRPDPIPRYSSIGIDNCMCREVDYQMFYRVKGEDHVD